MNVAIVIRPAGKKGDTKSFTIYGAKDTTEILEYLKNLIRKDNPERLIK